MLPLSTVSKCSASAYLFPVGKASLLLFRGGLPLCCALLLLGHELVKLASQPLSLSLQLLTLQCGSKGGTADGFKNDGKKHNDSKCDVPADCAIPSKRPPLATEGCCADAMYSELDVNQANLHASIGLETLAVGCKTLLCIRLGGLPLLPLLAEACHLSQHGIVLALHLQKRTVLDRVAVWKNTSLDPACRQPL